MASRIQLRRDTSANWTSANPILAQGEMGLETDTLKLKFGDGSTAWTSLDYYSTGLIDGSGATDQFARWVDNNTLEGLTAEEVRTALNVEDGAEANNISDTDATDLTDSGDSSLHYHSSDRDRANHTGTQTASSISDFDTEVGNNSIVTANTTHRGQTDNPHTVTKTQVGLSNVDNTSDVDKPVSTATQTALDLKIDTTDIIDNLTSTDTDKPLSANQGKVLNDAIENISLMAEIENKLNDNLITESFVWDENGNIERKDYKDSSSVVVYKKDYIWGVDGITSWTITRISDSETMTCTFAYTSGELTSKIYS